MKIKIQDIAYHLPEAFVTNKDLEKENPLWNMRIAESRTGVKKRHIVNKDETALDLAVKCCKALFKKNKDLEKQVDGILFSTQSADYPLPPNACALHGQLELRENLMAFDINLGCSAYVYGLAIAEGLTTSGQCRNILLVTSDTYSRFINEKDRSARVLFGDGAAASWITASEDDADGVKDIICSTSGKGYESFIVRAGGARMPKSTKTCLDIIDESGNVRTLENIYMNGRSILSFVTDKVTGQIMELLDRNSLEPDDIDLFVFHQASKMALDTLRQILKLKSEKVFTNLSEIGNTVAASIPIALRDALDQGWISKGDLVLISGFGVGLSMGAALIKF